MADITNGIVVAFGNTPQAKDDSFNGITEDSHAVILDVMGNDLGGNAKTLWSLDDGTSAGGIRPVDLLIQDTARTEALSSDRSALGATIWITSDGKVGYDVSANPTLVAALQHLAAGQYTTDTFTYAIRLGNGALSWATATVQIVGTNDGPVAVADTNAGDAVSESGVGPGNTPVAGDSTANGNVLTNDTDVDNGDTKTVSGVNGTAGNVGHAVTGVYGSLTLNSDGTYTYTLNNSDSDTNQLAQGASAHDVFTYTMVDSQGATSSTTLTITITGTNDAPVITSTAADAAGAVTEAGNLDNGTVVAGTPSASGTLTSSDVDAGTTATWSGNVTGTYGAFAINASTGVWTYTLDNSDGDTQALKEGQTVTETFTGTVTDDL